MVAIEVHQCGAGDRVPADQAGYACAACGSRMVFRRCSPLPQVVQLDALNTSNNRACSYCAAPITGGWVNASAQDQEQQLVHSGHPGSGPGPARHTSRRRSFSNSGDYAWLFMQCAVPL